MIDDIFYGSNNVKNSAVIINDPVSVKKLKNYKIGDFCKLIIGDMQNHKKQNKMILKVKLINKTNGKFTLEDKRSHLAASRGEKIQMGNCALVRCSGVNILLTSIKTPPFDLGQWKSQGIDPATLKVIGIKAAAAYRQAYDKISTIAYNVKTTGPCQNDLKKMGIKPGNNIQISTRRGEISLKARQDTDIPEGMVFVPFCYSEAAANILTDPQLDPVGKIPEFKFCAARVEPN